MTGGRREPRKHFDAPEEEQPGRIVGMFRDFVQEEAAGGVLLLAAAAVALVWANGAFAESYHRLWETHFRIAVGGFELDKSLHHWINDGLMAVFFLVVGLEIKREVLVGELSSPRQSALPLAAAMGGMVVPAGLYVAVAGGGAAMDGWAIPMATDIAFALGVLALLGDRVPTSLKVFLAALAIADDLGAVIVIALFYTSELSLEAMSAAGVILMLLFAANRGGVRRLPIYGLLGIALWFAVLKSGVHATLAGVLLALFVPARRKIDRQAFLERVEGLLRVIRGGEPTGELAEDAGEALADQVEGDAPDRERIEAIHALELSCRQVDSPLARMEHILHPWSAFLVMPLFALANAGVGIDAGALGSLGSGAGLGIVLGLFVGKQVGVTGFAWLAVRTGFASLPDGVSWRKIHGTACLCGIGFTMSLFIAGLAFDQAALLDGAKIAILTASLASGALGAWLLATAPGAGSPTRRSTA